MRAIQVQQFGGPEVLELVDIPEPKPGPGVDVITVTAAGINYADTHHTENSYLAAATLPFVPGAEAVGLTSDGRRVVSLLTGGYAEKALAPQATSFDVPEGVSDGQALALILQGLTAWHTLQTVGHIKAGDTVVVHAAAGGVGSLAVQLAKHFGAGRVIGTTSSPDKAELARSLGADEVVDANSADLVGDLRAANGGRAVDLVLEMTGGPVLDASLQALAPFGRLVVYGGASRIPPKPVEPFALMAKSRAVAGFWLMHCVPHKELLGPPLAEMFALVAAGTLQPVVGGTYGLSDVRQAHEDLRARKTIGKLVLDPSR